MKNHENLIKILSFILVFIVILIFIILIVLNKLQGNKTVYQEEEIGIIKDTNFKCVQSPTMFYTVENLVEMYLDYVHLDYEREEIDGRVQTLASKYDIYSEEQKLNEIIRLLDVKYIEENNIAANNLKDYIKIDNDEVVISKIIKMKSLEEEQFQFYIINVEVTTESSSKYNEYYVVTLDEYNSTWMIRPINNCNNIDEVQVNKDIESINNDNVYSYERVTDSEMAETYFIKYKQLILNNSKEAYEKLDEQYRAKRFNDYKGFEQYINKNKPEIETLSVDEYLVNEYDDYREYVCKDKYENIYKFKAISVIDYTVELDTYTITSEKFKEKYDNANAQNKVMMNIDKWIKMLNNRDYTAAFYVLDETFRNNNFDGDVNVFETYIKSKYPAHYKVKFSSFTEKPGDVYSQDIVLTEIGTDSSSEQETTIIMKLQEDINFAMSFSKE